MERRIAAILAADMVGFSHLIEQDEPNTLLRQKAILHGIIEPALSAHDGQLIKTTGDGLIAEFGSVVQAVQCALEIQKNVKEQELDQPPESRIAYRMAVHIGDLVFDDGDIFGDGVNVVARLEALAPEGGVVVSGTAHEFLKKHPKFEFRSLGEKRLKNISDPVQLFEIVTCALPRTARKKTFGSLPRLVAVAGVVILMLVGLTIAIRMDSGNIVPAVPREEPSIVVLPLKNISNDVSQDYLARGLTEDITTDLSQMKQIFVVSRNTAFSYAKNETDPRLVSRDLGVQFVLSGSLRRIGQTLRINMTLVDGSSGGQLWAQRFDGSQDDVLTFQDSVITSVVDALPLHLNAEQIDKGNLGGTKNAEAFDAYLKGWDYYKLRTPEDVLKSVDNLKKAVELDPDYGRAYAVLAAAYFDAWRVGWWDEFGLDDVMNTRLLKKDADRYLKEALRNPSVLAYLVAARIDRVDGKLAEMEAAAEAALELDANDPDAHYTLALAKTLNGEHGAALSAIEHAMTLDRYFPPEYLMLRGGILFSLERFEEAIQFLRRAVEENPESQDAEMFQLATLSRLELPLEKELRASKRKSATVDGYVLHWGFKKEEDRDRLANALSAAGLTDRDW